MAPLRCCHARLHACEVLCDRNTQPQQLPPLTLALCGYIQTVPEPGAGIAAAAADEHEEGHRRSRDGTGLT